MDNRRVLEAFIAMLRQRIERTAEVLEFRDTTNGENVGVYFYTMTVCTEKGNFTLDEMGGLELGMEETPEDRQQALDQARANVLYSVFVKLMRHTETKLYLLEQMAMDMGLVNQEGLDNNAAEQALDAALNKPNKPSKH
jgi:hypothetical protein